MISENYATCKLLEVQRVCQCCITFVASVSDLNILVGSPMHYRLSPYKINTEK